MTAREQSPSFRSTPSGCGKTDASPVVSDKPRKPQQRSARTRELMLDAAEEIFIRDGYEKAALADIAQTAGKTRGAIYSHFKDKEEMFLALIELHVRRRGSGLQELLQELELAEGLFSKPLQRLVESVDHPEEGVLIMEFLLYALRHPHLSDRFGLGDAVVAHIDLRRMSS